MVHLPRSPLPLENPWIALEISLWDNHLKYVSLRCTWPWIHVTENVRH